MTIAEDAYFDVCESETVEQATFKQRIEGNTIDLYCYNKHDACKKGTKTGTALLINQVQNLAVVDIDIVGETSEEKSVIREEICKMLSPDDLIVQTCSGGLHVYCNTDGFPVLSNRMIKYFTCEEYDVDLMSSIEPDKRSLIVLPGSRVRKDHRSKVTEYSFLRGDENTVVTRSIQEVLDSLSIEAKSQEDTTSTHELYDDQPDVIISNELTEAIVEGLKGLTIHNDGGNRPIDKEITLFTLFPALNSLNRMYIDKAYDIIREECDLTMNALKNFTYLRVRYSKRETSPYVLVKMLKIWKPQYYEESIKPILEKEKPVIQSIDINDDFMMADIKAKSEKGLYTTDHEVLEDLSRVLRFLPGTDNMFLLKTYDARKKRYNVSFSKDDKMYKYMKSVRICSKRSGDKNKKNTVSLYDIFNKYESLFTVKGVCFNTDEKNVFNFFQGFKWKVLEEVDRLKIQPYLSLIKEVICDNDEVCYNYILSWIATIVQQPGFKTEVALVLKGLQGIGKGTFTDILCELFNGYSAPNVTDIQELTGTFNSVVENKMLIILNELKNCGDERGANWNALKSIITENEIRINEKNMARRDGENVANFIFVTNNAFPVKIENGDRRYLVLRANGKYKGRFLYFQTLRELQHDEDFYDNLLTFFMQRDISYFNTRYIPETEAKMDLVQYSLSPIEQFICENYEKLCKGWAAKEARDRKPYDIKNNSFALLMKEKCNYVGRTIEGKRKFYYVLKDDCKEVFKKLKENMIKDEDTLADAIPDFTSESETCLVSESDFA